MPWVGLNYIYRKKKDYGKTQLKWFRSTSSQTVALNLPRRRIRKAPGVQRALTSAGRGTAGAGVVLFEPKEFLADTTIASQPLEPRICSTYAPNKCWNPRLFFAVYSTKRFNSATGGAVPSFFRCSILTKNRKVKVCQHRTTTPFSESIRSRERERESPFPKISCSTLSYCGTLTHALNKNRSHSSERNSNAFYGIRYRSGPWDCVLALLSSLQLFSKPLVG